MCLSCKVFHAPWLDYFPGESAPVLDLIANFITVGRALRDTNRAPIWAFLRRINNKV